MFKCYVYLHIFTISTGQGFQPRIEISKPFRSKNNPWHLDCFRPFFRNANGKPSPQLKALKFLGRFMNSNMTQELGHLKCAFVSFFGGPHRETPVASNGSVFATLTTTSEAEGVPNSWCQARSSWKILKTTWLVTSNDEILGQNMVQLSGKMLLRCTGYLCVFLFTGISYPSKKTLQHMDLICPKLPNPSDFLHVKSMNVMTTLKKNLQFWICFHRCSPTFLCPIQLRNRRQKAVCSPHFSKGKSPEKLDYHRVLLLLPPNKNSPTKKQGSLETNMSPTCLLSFKWVFVDDLGSNSLWKKDSNIDNWKPLFYSVAELNIDEPVGYCR